MPVWLMALVMVVVLVFILAVAVGLVVFVRAAREAAEQWRKNA